MGYVCPVCEDPQADGEHLANHLAFTAMLGDDAHEAWLDDHAPGWEASGPESLAERVVDHADEREFPQVFEDTTGHDAAGEGHGHHDERVDPRRGCRDEDGDGAGTVDHGRTRDAATSDLPGRIDADVPGSESLPPEVLAEARELTRERRDAGGSGEGGDDGRADDGGDPGAEDWGDGDRRANDVDGQADDGDRRAGDEGE